MAFTEGTIAQSAPLGVISQLSVQPLAGAAELAVQPSTVEVAPAVVVTPAVVAKPEIGCAIPHSPVEGERKKGCGKSKDKKDRKDRSKEDKDDDKDDEKKKRKVHYHATGDKFQDLVQKPGKKWREVDGGKGKSWLEWFGPKGKKERDEKNTVVLVD